MALPWLYLLPFQGGSRRKQALYRVVMVFFVGAVILRWAVAGVGWSHFSSQIYEISSSIVGVAGTAFTLVELLVVIAIIGILVALLLAGDSGGARGEPAGDLPEHDSPVGRRDAELPLGQEQVAGGEPHQSAPRVGGLHVAVRRGPIARGAVRPDECISMSHRIRITSTTDGIYAKPVPTYYCPSDRPGALWKGDIYWRRAAIT